MQRDYRAPRVGPRFELTWRQPEPPAEPWLHTVLASACFWALMGLLLWGLPLVLDG